MGADKSSGSAEIDILISSRLEAYANLCASDLTAVDALLLETVPSPEQTAPNANATVARRDTSGLLCIYALPEIVSAASPVVTYVTSNRLWLVFAFPVIALLCMIRRRL
ncbi:hypothetical protein OBBRIDRAFT_795170 [Obba rivulosa]|uniref:Uncharacterized protein n=1 Tax=Obba rivulosa TaxID=1052685 RepID=A0A8E2AUU8_9APHY|nr:hypothetical protein OBBRIDRAFT_795170 [Obba rivulosa]